MNKILVVDDSLLIRRTFVRSLKSSGYVVVTAGNGKEAVEKIQKELFDLILMDLIMPVMEGFEAIRQIRAIKSLPFIPIIIVSSLEASKDINRALNLGANEYVVKPVDKMALNARVKAMLQLKDSYEKEKRSEGKYEKLLQALPDVIYKLDSEGNFVFVNDSIRTLGYEPNDLVGKHFSEFIHSDDVPLISSSFVLPNYKGKTTNRRSAPKLFDEKRSLDRATRGLEIRIVPKDMGAGKESLSCKTVMVKIAFSEVASAGQHDPQTQETIGTVGIIRDITERKQAEQMLITAKKEAEKANKNNKEKELLLREIHHRVKNNMQVISSLLTLQSRYVGDEQDKKVFEECQNRIQSMAFIHEKLYQSKNLEKIDFNEYVRGLANGLFRFYKVNTSKVVLNIDVKDIFLGIDTAIPCGLIINEIISNSLKYAFPSEKKGEICIVFQKNKDEYELIIMDNGAGISKDLDFRNTESLGLQLVTMLTEQQLNGKIELSRDEGTEFRIKFKEVKYKERI